MKPSLLFCLLLPLWTGLPAQYGTTYTFHFALLDSAFQFHSEQDAPQCTFRLRKESLYIDAGQSEYWILTKKSGPEISLTSGKIDIHYPVVPPATKGNFEIIRKTQQGRDTMTCRFLYLADDDEARLHFAPGKREVDLTFGRRYQLYQLLTDSTAAGKRDLSCLLNLACEPVFTPTKRLLRQQKKRETGMIQHLHLELQRKADSLMQAVFPHGLTKQFFVQTCVKSFCLNRSPSQNCELIADTTCLQARFTYEYRPEGDFPLAPLTIWCSYRGQPRFETVFGLATHRFSEAELRMMTARQLQNHIQREYPETDFFYQNDSLLNLGLVFLATLPSQIRSQSWQHPEPPFPEPIAPALQTQASWHPRFAYYVNSLAGLEAEPDLAFVWYFEATSGTLICKLPYLTNQPEILDH